MNIYYHKNVFVDVYLPRKPIVLIVIPSFSVNQFLLNTQEKNILKFYFNSFYQYYNIVT